MMGKKKTAKMNKGGTAKMRGGGKVAKMNMGGRTGDMMYSRGYGADERSKFLQYSLGTSDPTKANAPVWQILTLQNEISKVQDELTQTIEEND